MKIIGCKNADFLVQVDKNKENSWQELNQNSISHSKINNLTFILLLFRNLIQHFDAHHSMLLIYYSNATKAQN